jgi:hypothetical protein
VEPDVSRRQTTARQLADLIARLYASTAAAHDKACKAVLKNLLSFIVMPNTVEAPCRQHGATQTLQVMANALDFTGATKQVCAYLKVIHTLGSSAHHLYVAYSR